VEVSVTNKHLQREKKNVSARKCVWRPFSIVCRVSWSWIPHDADANLDQVVPQGMELAILA